MKKKLLGLAMVAVLVVGCGGGGAKEEPRLSKEEYLTQVTDKMKEMQSMQAELTKNPDEGVVKVTELIDGIIALKGPKKLDEQEKSIDDSLTDFNELLKTAKDVRTNPEKQTKYISDLTAIATELNKSEQAYRSAK